MKLLRAFLLLLLLGAGNAYAQLPSIHDIYLAASSGRLDVAQADVDQVLAAYPDSAKAHYVDARVLALQGRWSDAATALATAQRLDPGLGFERPATLQAFEQQLAAHGPAQHAGVSGIGWIGAALALLAVLVLFAVYRASRRPPVQVVYPAGDGYAPNGYGAPGYGQAPGYPPQPGAGGGMLGAVGRGLGMGAGFAAGEMLVDRLFEHGAGGGMGGGFVGDASAAPLPDDQDFGIADAGSWTDASGGGGDSWS
jgi:hypothetical protein